MAKYPAVITTMAGTNTIAEANATKQALIFTKIVIGAGDMPASIPRATALTDKRLELEITKSVKTGDGQFMVQGLLSNKTLAAGFYAREIGLMAKAGKNGKEVLFSYTNGGNYVDYIPDKNTPMDSYTFTITTVIGNAEKVQAVISDNGLASIHDLDSSLKSINDTLNKKYDKSGGTLSGDIVFTGNRLIRTDGNSTGFQIFSGDGWKNGAHINLSSSNAESKDNQGSFSIVASANNAYKYLIGRTDGRLTWDGDDIIRQSMLATTDTTSALSQAPTLKLVKSLLSGLNIKSSQDVLQALGTETLQSLGVKYDFSNEKAWYICLGKLFGGLIIQGGITSMLSDNSTGGTKPTQTFPISFSIRCLSVLANINYYTSLDGAPSVHTYIKDKSQFIVAMDCDESSSNVYAFWLAIGY